VIVETLACHDQFAFRTVPEHLVHTTRVLREHCQISAPPLRTLLVMANRACDGAVTLLLLGMSPGTASAEAVGLRKGKEEEKQPPCMRTQDEPRTEEQTGEAESTGLPACLLAAALCVGSKSDSIVPIRERLQIWVPRVLRTKVETNGTRAAAGVRRSTQVGWG
jgi:hypothetical protein